MTKKINQACRKINTEDIINKKFYPVWFFTNERAEKFLLKIKERQGIKHIFSVGGGGDFIFNCLSVIKEIKKVDVCDIRQLACVTIDIKRAIIKKHSFREVEKILRIPNSQNKKKVYQKIKEKLDESSKEVLKNILQSNSRPGFLDCLKKSKYWYKESFSQIKKKHYLLYFKKENYRQLKKKINTVSIYTGDFYDNLKVKRNNSYDLIYVSNIFDSKKYCKESNLYLTIIEEKLKKNAFLLVVTQNSPKKIIKEIEEKKFKLQEKEINKFNIFEVFLGHYSYSFLLFKKNEE